MPLQWTDGASVTIEHLCVILYGAPGTGKTTLALTANRPALIDFDGGVHRAANRAGKRVLPRLPFAEVERLDDADLKGIDTLVIDSLGPMIDNLAADASGGRAPQVQDWGKVRARFLAWMSRLRERNVDVVFIAHTDEREKAGVVVERIQAAGSSKDIAYQRADLMGRVSVDEKFRYWCDFRPSAGAYAKDAGVGLVGVQAPSKAPDTLAQIIERAKGYMSASAEASAEEHEHLTQMRAHLEAASVDDLTAMVQGAAESGLGDVEKQLVREEAHRRKLRWDKAAGKFVA